jgi:hypothetical protein
MKRKFQLRMSAVFAAASLLFVTSCGNYDDKTTIPDSRITLNKADTTIFVDGTVQLTATVTPPDAANPAVDWSSSNATVATVTDDGLVTGISIGTATITATAPEINATATCVITVGYNINGVPTGWSAPPVNRYEYSMTYVAQVAFRGILSTDTNTEIAAFAGNECRGFAKLEYEPLLNVHLVHLTIYSNNAGETITLKAWNPLNKLIYNNCRSFPFQSNAQLGSLPEILDCYP